MALQGQIRFYTPSDAQMAIDELDGSEFDGAPIRVDVDPRSPKGGTNLLIDGLVFGDDLRGRLRRHFEQIGRVMFVTTGVGEVRFDTAEAARQAIEAKDGTFLDDNIITVMPHPNSADGTKVRVLGLSPNTRDTLLKYHFREFGWCWAAGPGTAPRRRSSSRR